jgi:hypothetical protein
MIGTTCEEVEDGTSLKHQTVSARRTELRKYGYTDYLLDAVGNRTRRATKSGRAAYIEIATQKGIATIKNGWPIVIGDGHDPTASRHHGNPMSDAAFASSEFASARRIVLQYMGGHTPPLKHPPQGELPL